MRCGPPQRADGWHGWRPGQARDDGPRGRSGRRGAGRHGAWVDRFGAEAGAPGTPRAPDSWGRGGVGPSGATPAAGNQLYWMRPDGFEARRNRWLLVEAYVRRGCCMRDWRTIVLSCGVAHTGAIHESCSLFTAGLIVLAVASKSAGAKGSRLRACQRASVLDLCCVPRRHAARLERRAENWSGALR